MRILINFFIEKNHSDDINASDYIQDYKAKNDFKGSFWYNNRIRANKSVGHMTYQRTTDIEEKTWEIAKITEGLTNEIMHFTESLDGEYKNLMNKSQNYQEFLHLKNSAYKAGLLTQQTVK